MQCSMKIIRRGARQNLLLPKEMFNLAGERPGVISSERRLSLSPAESPPISLVRTNSAPLTVNEPTSDTQPKEQLKRTFPPPNPLPTQVAQRGIRFDGNDGCRVALPEGDWRVRISDIDAGNILYETKIRAGAVRTRKKYFCRFRIEVWDLAAGRENLVLSHDYNALDKDVLIQLPVGTLGDTLGWFPYVEKFRLRHGCKITCAMSAVIVPLFRETYPEINFVTHEEVTPDLFYASYSIGLFFDDVENNEYQPCDFRLVGLHRTAGYILGVDPTEEPPRVALPDLGRPMAEPYVVIATQSSTQCKYWNNPSGWRDVVLYLKKCGYRVVCIDQKPFHGGGLTWNHLPHGVEDETGDRPLAERANWLKHAEFFIGLSSGLSWLAWAVRIPVVLISGFTHPINEFVTPYRVINYNACNSCWNDPKIRFDHKDFLWCPRHKDTSRQFECTRLITFAQVKSILQTIPGFLQSPVSQIDATAEGARA